MGCTDMMQWKSYKASLKAYQLTSNDVGLLNPLLERDATALYIKSLQTFSQALAGLKRGEFAWTLVKMYYSVFYAMRCEMSASSIITVMNGGILYAENKQSATLHSIQGHGSHQAYINLRKTLPPSAIAHDVLLGNQIDAGEDVYTWMRENRERTNYQMKHFPDPDPDVVLNKVYTDYANLNKLTEAFKLYKTNSLYCFDIDHATLAVPYTKLCICHGLLQGRVQPDATEQKQIAESKRLLLAVGIESALADELVI